MKHFFDRHGCGFPGSRHGFGRHGFGMGPDFFGARFGGFGKGVYRLPDSYHRIVDGETIRIGEHDWTVVVGHGHSPEHACLHSPALRLLISGDQVLPRISSNVSVFPTEPDADPLGDWIESLAKLERALPDVILLDVQLPGEDGLLVR